MSARRTTIAISSIVLPTVAAMLLGTGTASAEPGDWANVPGYTGSESSGQPAGTLLSSTEVPTPATVKVPSRTYVLEYEDGTGQITKESLIVPESSYDGVRPIYTYVAPTDSLDPAMAPSKKFFGDGSGIDMSMPNEWLEGGGSVLIPDSYGDENPEYAGVNNGVRVKNGMLAAQQHVGEEAPIVCGGFSGGGLDCGRVAEDKTVNVPNYRGTIISGAPANMHSVVRDAMGHEQSGLISVAAMPGVYRSLSDEEKAALDPMIRPSAKHAFETMDFGGANSQYATYLGLVGIKADWIFQPGALDDPAVQAIFDKASLGNFIPDAPVLVAGNQSDPWMVWARNGALLAEQYTSGGADVDVIVSNLPGWPGHQDISVADQLSWFNQQLPEGSKLTETEVEPEESTNPPGMSLAPIIGAVGPAIENLVPQISEQLDKFVPDTLDALDTGISVP